MLPIIVFNYLNQWKPQKGSISISCCRYFDPNPENLYVLSLISDVPHRLGIMFSKTLYRVGFSYTVNSNQGDSHISITVDHKNQIEAKERWESNRIAS